MERPRRYAGTEVLRAPSSVESGFGQGVGQTLDNCLGGPARKGQDRANLRSIDYFAGNEEFSSPVHQDVG